MAMAIRELEKFAERFITLQDRLQELGSSSSDEESLTLINHTEGNIIKLATHIQDEGSIGYHHRAVRRRWVAEVSFGMGVEEPVQQVAKLLSHTAYPRVEDTLAWGVSVTHRKALQLLQLIKPHLTADRLEEAQYMLNIAETTIPDTEYRPMYKGIIERAIRPILLYEKYATFPIKYSKVIRKGETLPQPTRHIFPLKYTPQAKPILWKEGIRLE